MLSLLADLAEDGPLLCLVDDAHWLDRASAAALVFAARRLGAEGIAVIFAARDHDAPFPAPGLPVLRLGGLDTASAAALLREYGAGLPAAVQNRVLAEACGNPLGLIELSLAASMFTCGRAGASPVLTDRLRQAFEGQVRLPRRHSDALPPRLLRAAATRVCWTQRTLGVVADLEPASSPADRHCRWYRHVPPSAGARGGTRRTLVCMLAVHRRLSTRRAIRRTPADAGIRRRRRPNPMRSGGGAGAYCGGGWDPRGTAAAPHTSGPCS